MPDLVRLALQRAVERLTDRLVELEQAEPLNWPEYIATVIALTSALASTSPGADGRMLTTAEMAARLGVTARTLLAKKKAGKVAPAVVLGKRGTGAIRWKTTG
jgi:hypothetical protein